MNERLKVYDTKMQKTQASLEAELATIRAGRANPHVLDKITVDYYGMQTPLQQVANISVPEARMIQIQPWERSLIKAIEKINEADAIIFPIRNLSLEKNISYLITIWVRVIRAHLNALVINLNSKEIIGQKNCK